MTRLQAGLVAFIALVIGIVAALTISPKQSAEEQYLSRYPQPRALPDFQLTDNRGQSFTSAQLKDHWSLVFVGYTFCPDVCPTTLADLDRVYPQLKAMPSDYPIQVVFLSVDPKRDTSERLDEYVNFFDPEFIGVSGEHKYLFPLVKAMGMMYSMSDSTDNPNYLVDHSSSVVLVNPQAQVIGRFKAKFEPGKIALSDSQLILADMAIVTRH
ncbi:MAG: SCO family protein [Paraglaciecola sp.]|nr:SCO family protein [Paraglaciecola sp.]